MASLHPLKSLNYGEYKGRLSEGTSVLIIELLLTRKLYGLCGGVAVF